MWIKGYAARIGYTFGLCAALSACDQSDCTGGQHLSEYRISNYSMQFSEYFQAETLTGEDLRIYTPESVINPLDFALVLTGEVGPPTQSDNATAKFRLRWFAEAHACSPAYHQLPVQRVVRYEITSTASFMDYPAGTDITPIFLEEYRLGPDAASISPFIEGNITDDEIPPQQQTLRLAAVPDDTHHVFTATIELDDGAFYEFVSPTVVFDLEE